MVNDDVWVDDHPTLELPVVPLQPHYHPVAHQAPTMYSSVRHTAQDISSGIVKFLKAAWVPLKFVLKVVGVILAVAIMLVIAIIPYLDPDPNGFRRDY